MTLASDWVEATARHMLAGQRERIDKLSASVTAGAASVTLQYGDQVNDGDYLSVGLEIMYVWSVSGSTAQVERGMLGSTADAHAQGELVTINPRFPKFVIFDALNSELRDLSSQGLYAMKQMTLTTSATSHGYNLGAQEMLDIYKVAYDPAGPENAYPEIKTWKWSTGYPSDDFPSGQALILPGTVEPGRTLRVWYKAPLGQLTALNNNVTTFTSIPGSAEDIPPLGAAARLLATREGKRVQIESQPETRRLDEVSVGAATRAAQTLLALRAQRISAEVSRLNTAWPVRLRR